MPLNSLRSLGFLVLAAAASAFAADPPGSSEPITLVVPFPAWGPTDAVGRTLAQALEKALDQKVTVRNVAGAGGTLGAERVAKARPDGTTLLLTNIGQATALSLYPNLRYHPVDDFEPIGLVADVPMTLVARPGFPADQLKESMDIAKGSKGKVTYGHAGIGSASYLCGLLLMSALQSSFATVNYRGTAQAMTDIAGDRVDLMCDQITNTLEPIKAGKVKVLGVSTRSRLPAFPDVPTLSEAGLPDFELTVWHGLYAPKGTPPPVLEKLAAALQQALADPQLKAKLADLGAQPVALEQARPAALRTRLKAELDKWGPIVQQAAVYAD